MQTQRCATDRFDSRHQRRPRLRHQAILTLALALVMIPGIALSQPPLAHALGTPTLSWDSSMVYSGQNGGNPWGPPGENALVHGANFQAGQQLGLALAQGNSNNNPAICKSGLVTVAQVTVSASGSFEQSFIWPTTLVNLPGLQYSICAQDSQGHVVSTQDAHGPFTVLTSGPPSFNLSTNTVAPGGSITVNGLNWVPDQEVDVDVVLPKGPGFITHAQVNSGGGMLGTFSANLTIPANTAPGNYVVTAFTTQNNLLSTTNTNTNQNLTVTGSGSTATPTPTTTASVTPTLTPSPTAVPTPTATVVTPTVTTTAGTGTGSSNNTGSPGGDNTLFYLLLAAIAIVLLAIGGLLIFMLAQRKRPTSAPGRFNQSGSMGQLCVRCGALMAPNAPVCGNCGTPNSFPNWPGRG